MLSAENKPSAFNKFCSADLDFEQVTLAKYKENQTYLLHTTDDYSKPYIENLNFCFHDFDPDPITLVLKLDLD